jgi:hypothetical protein
MNRLSDAIKGKEVLLVGNSSSIIGAGLGSKIELSEFVIRFNLSIAHLNSCTGMKTDAWVFAMKREEVCQRIYNNAIIKPDLCVRHDRHPRPELDFNFLPLDVAISDVQNDLQTTLDPSVGVCTLWYVLNCSEPKKVSIVGFDSFSNRNFYRKKNTSRSQHPVTEEDNYISKLKSSQKIDLLN